MKESGVECTLLFGPNMERWKCVVLLICAFVSIVIAIICLVYAIIDDDSLYIVAGYSAFMGIGCGFCILEPYKQKRKINKWLKDAVDLLGTCDYSSDDLKKSDGTCKISIKFEFDGKTLIRTSGSQSYHPLTWTRDGYQKVYKKYVGGTISIWYSPTCDEVMIPYQ